jgi:hypothetical protein
VQKKLIKQLTNSKRGFSHSKSISQNSSIIIFRWFHSAESVNITAKSRIALENKIRDTAFEIREKHIALYCESHPEFIRREQRAERMSLAAQQILEKFGDCLVDVPSLPPPPRLSSEEMGSLVKTFDSLYS